MIHQLIKPSLFILFIVSICWIIYRFLKPRKRSAGFELLLFFFIIYIAIVLLITLYPLPITREKVAGAKGVNFIPVMNEWKEYLESFRRGKSFMRNHVMQNIFGNILLFIPFGTLLPIVSTKFRSFGKIFLGALLFSLSIEILQWVSRQYEVYRSVDIDDVILNVIGAVIGFALMRLFVKIKQ